MLICCDEKWLKAVNHGPCEIGQVVGLDDNNSSFGKIVAYDQVKKALFVDVSKKMFLAVKNGCSTPLSPRSISEAIEAAGLHIPSASYIDNPDKPDEEASFDKQDGPDEELAFMMFVREDCRLQAADESNASQKNHADFRRIQA